MTCAEITDRCFCRRCSSRSHAARTTERGYRLSLGVGHAIGGDLIDQGIVVEVDSVGSDGGRPRALLQVSADYGYIIGVDVSEIRVRVELFDLAMAGRARADYPLDSGEHGAGLIVEAILTGLGAVLADSGVNPAAVLGLGVAAPGIVESGPMLSCTGRPSAGSRSRWVACCGPGPGCRCTSTMASRPWGRRNVVRRRAGRAQRDRLPDRFRRGGEHHRERSSAPRRHLQRRRVGAHHRQGGRPRLPVRVARLPGGLRRRRGNPRPVRQGCPAATRKPSAPR